MVKEKNRQETHMWEISVWMLGEQRWAERHLSRWALIFWRKVDTSSTTYGTTMYICLPRKGNGVMIFF